jgi:hypothetical protein
MTGNCDILSNVNALCEDVYVTYGNNVKLKASGIGKAVIHTWEHPEGILDVPNAAYNLFSTLRAIKNGADVSFTKTGWVHRQSGRTHHSKGVRSGDQLYYVGTSQRALEPVYGKELMHLRLNRTIMESVRAMLEDGQLPPKQWGEAVANYLRPRSRWKPWEPRELSGCNGSVEELPLWATSSASRRAWLPRATCSERAIYGLRQAPRTWHLRHQEGNNGNGLWVLHRPQ